MAAETENALHKVDSLTEEHKNDAKKGHRRVSSMAADVYRIEDLGMWPPDETLVCWRGR